MPPYAERKKKFIDKLKREGKFEDYKKKRAKLEKERRIRMKKALETLSEAKRKQLIVESRIKNRKGVQRFRMRQKENKISTAINQVSYLDIGENRALSSVTENFQQPHSATEDCSHSPSITENRQKKQASISSTEHCNHPPSITENHLKQQASISQAENCSHAPSITENYPKQQASISSAENRNHPPSITENRQKQQASISPAENCSRPSHSYRTQSALSKAICKSKKSLPSSPSRRIAVATGMVRSFNKEDQQKIISNLNPKRSKTNTGLNSALVKEIRLFYERDDISRISPNVKDARKFFDPDTGVKEVRQLRHLTYKLSEVYLKFIDDFKENDGSTQIPVKLSKFCALRPEHVLLMSETPRNVCFCLYHANFIQCVTALHKYIPEFPCYGPTMTELLVCDAPTRECYFKTCSKCDSSIVDQKIRLIAKRSPNRSKNLQWLKWTKDEAANRFQNGTEKGSQKQLIDYFLSIYCQFLKHSYIKREQEQAFDSDRKRVCSNPDCSEALLQIDFAENFKCENQDEVQQAHYNQKQISLFTTALHYAGRTHSKVIASDNTHHTKETLVAYLYSIFKGLPSSIKIVRVWSDGPSNQFKNKYIGAIIPLFEGIFKMKIVWNFFAASHGKSCIDGIGAAVKSKVKELVLSREAIVNNTKDFVAAFNSKKSKVGLVEMTDADIDKINDHLQLNKIFSEAPAIREISKFHQMQFLNFKIKGFLTSADGYGN